MSRSSAALSEARTRMCSNTVPAMRGCNSSGALWHRLQFWRNLRSPGLSGVALPGCELDCGFDGLGATGCVGAPGVCAETTRKQHCITPSANSVLSFIVVYLAMRETGTDTPGS